MEITKIGKALSNETRIKILGLISQDDRSSIETYREYQNEFADDKHRETIYRELEHLVEVNLVEKYYDDEEKYYDDEDQQLNTRCAVTNSW